MGGDRENIAVLILAAGASTRMGRIKQLLPWGNITLLEHSINVAKETKASEVVVVLGANADIIKTEISLVEIQFTENPNWASGLGNSLAFGMKFLLKNQKSFDGVLVLLCDQPLMDKEYLNDLIDEFRKGEKSIVGTQYAENVGVPAIFDFNYFPDLLKLNQDHGAKKVLEQNKNDVLIIDAKGKAIDMDTYEDYQKLVRKRFA